MIDYAIPGKNYNCIQIDNYHGAYQAVDHLAKTGKKRIGFVGGTYFHPSIKERYRGYRDALEANNLIGNGMPEEYTFVENVETSPLIGEKGISVLLDRNADLDAVFCCNDPTAMGAMKEIQKRKIKIPDEIAIVGFDDIPTSGFCMPRLTTVSVPKLALGKEAFNLLNEVIDQPSEPPQVRTIGTFLVKRESA